MVKYYIEIIDNNDEIDMKLHNKEESKKYQIQGSINLPSSNKIKLYIVYENHDKEDIYKFDYLFIKTINNENDIQLYLNQLFFDIHGYRYFKFSKLKRNSFNTLPYLNKPLFDRKEFLNIVYDNAYIFGIVSKDDIILDYILIHPHI